MNASLLTNMFTVSVAQGPVPRKTAVAPDTTQSAPVPADIPRTTNPPETTTTDNTFDIAQDQPISKPPQEFRHALREKTITKESQRVQVSPQSKEPGPTSSATEQPHVVQQWFADHSAPVEHNKKGIATKIEPKAGYELAQLLTKLKTREFPPGTRQPGETAKSKAFLTQDKGLLDAHPQKNQESKNTQELRISNNPLVTQKALINIKNGKELMPEEGILTTNTTTAAEKPAMADKLAIPRSQITPPLTGKELVSKALSGDGKTTTAGENPAVTDKPAVSGGQKAPVLNDNLPSLEGKPSDSQQKTQLGPVKSGPVAKEPTYNKAQGDQQGQVMPELSNDNAKTQANNLAGERILQKLNPTQVQISANQTKDRNNPTSDNSSDSNFEQVLPTNDAQTPITEQVPASVGSAKTPNDASPDDVSASISKQILESVHSSLRQGDQQIIIRLHPPELGKVFIRFKEQQDQITGLLEVSKAQTRVEIQQALPQIIQNLQNSGIQIKRLEVLLTDQPEDQPNNDQSLQDGWSQQHGSPNPNPPRSNSDGVGINEWLVDTNNYAGFTEPQVQVSDNSIDMLI